LPFKGEFRLSITRDKREITISGKTQGYVVRLAPDDSKPVKGIPTLTFWQKPRHLFTWRKKYRTLDQTPD